jgi:hypothetical protein
MSDHEKRVQHYLDLAKSGIFPDPKTQGYRGMNAKKELEKDIKAQEEAMRRLEKS